MWFSGWPTPSHLPTLCFTLSQAKRAWISGIQRPVAFLGELQPLDGLRGLRSCPICYAHLFSRSQLYGKPCESVLGESKGRGRRDLESQSAVRPGRARAEPGAGRRRGKQMGSLVPQAGTGSPEGESQGLVTEPCYTLPCVPPFTCPNTSTCERGLGWKQGCCRRSC